MTEEIDHYAAEVAEMALLFAGEPDEKVASSLTAMRDCLEADLTAVVVNRLIQAILDRKAKIERSGVPMRRQ